MTRTLIVPLLLGALWLPTRAWIPDTVGYTERDRQAYGPSARLVVNDTARGIHTVWKDGYGDIRYNFKPRGADWRWPGGIVINPFPRNLGGMTVNLRSGRAIIGIDYVSRGVPRSAFLEDSAPGAGRFTERPLGTGYRHVVAATSHYGWARFAAIRNDTLGHLSHFSSLRLARLGSFPTHSLAGSKQSGRFGHIWSVSKNPDYGTLYFKETPNNGMNWYPTVNLSDSVPSRLDRNLLGGQCIYDSIRLRLVAGFYNGTNRNQSELWLYAKYDSPPWYAVHSHTLPDSVDIGDAALGAGRPTIGWNARSNDYFVAWEQFDPANIDPQTGLARADVWVSRSGDGGHTWGEPIRLTAPDSTSKRFPFLAETVNDTLHILYFADRVAGFQEQGQGPTTRNPVLLLRIPAESIPTALHEIRPAPVSPMLIVTPTVSRTGFTVRAGEAVSCELLDQAGRVVRRFTLPGRGSNWNCRLPAGVFFLRAVGPTGSVAGPTIKLVRLP